MSQNNSMIQHVGIKCGCSAKESTALIKPMGSATEYGVPMLTSNTHASMTYTRLNDALQIIAGALSIDYLFYPAASQ